MILNLHKNNSLQSLWLIWKMSIYPRASKNSKEQQSHWSLPVSFPGINVVCHNHNFFFSFSQCVRLPWKECFYLFSVNLLELDTYHSATVTKEGEFPWFPVTIPAPSSFIYWGCDILTFTKLFPSLVKKREEETAHYTGWLVWKEGKLKNQSFIISWAWLLITDCWLLVTLIMKHLINDHID